ncbi:Non-ribosomal peptide synthetase component F [Paenibacillus sp. OK003]|nr:Non-ribosomal peptide synthetase component F [Paenibacillus sp. OK003]
MGKVVGLSPLQLGIWSRIQLYKENSEYEIPLLIEINSEISGNEIEQALNSVIEYNAALRAEIIGDVHPMQKIHGFRPSRLVKEIVTDTNMQDALRSFLDKPLSLEKTLTMYKLFIGGKCQILACKFHHIISDGHSVELFEREFRGLLAGQHLKKDKELYQHYLEGDRNTPEDVSAYWDTYLDQLMTPLEAHKRVSGKSRSILRTDLQLSVSQLESYASQVGNSVFTSGLGIYRMFLSRFFGKENYAIGLPITTRKNEAEENTFAFMANVLPLLVPLEFEQTGSHVQQLTQTTVLDLIMNSSISATEIQKKLDGKYKHGKEALLKTIFDLQQESEDSWVALVRESSTESEYPWLSNLILKQGKVYFETNHECSFYPKWFLEEIHKSFQVFIHSVIEMPHAKINEYSLLSKSQNTEILSLGQIALSQKSHQVESEELFTNYKSQHQTILYKDKLVTFNVLENYLKQFKQFLHKHRIRIGAKFVVCTKNKLIGSILFYCIQKNHGCYIPISSEMPVKRIKQIIIEANPMIVISDWLDLSQDNHLRLTDDTELASLAMKEVKVSVNDTTKYLDGISYVIFTSGSTGKPKGVPISYKNLSSLVAQYKKFNVMSTDIVAQVASFSFDASLFEMTLAFHSGAQLAIFDSSMGYEHFPQFIQKAGVTHYLLTPDYYSVLDFSECHSLKCILVGGSAYRKNKTIPNHTVVYNAYGPSEGTIITSVKKMNGSAEPTNIGRPLENSGVALLNNRGELVPHGVTGEICITGQSMFSSYLDSDLPMSFQTICIEDIDYLFYRTGDIGYLDEKWDIHFVSRKQNLVKIRGNRVDPEEVSQLAMSLGTVFNAVTIVENNDLATFYIGTAATQRLEKLFQEYLPSYMIPSYILQLDAIPVTINGKTDFEQLSKLITTNDSDIFSKVEEEVNHDLLEVTILKVFQKILKNDTFSLQSNFFAEGGDSIQSIQIANELQKESLNISSLDIIKCQNIQELCEKVRTKQRDFNQEPVVGEVDLLPIQKWFFSHSFSNINHWNQSERFTITGDYTKEQLLTVYEQIRLKHDNLRSQFLLKEHQYINVIRENRKEDIDQEFSFYEVSKNFSENERNQWIRSVQAGFHEEIAIQEGSLSRIGFFQISKNSFVVVWVLHHLICDNVSWLILKNDLLYGLELIEQEQPLKLTEKTTSIKDWADYLRNMKLSEEVIQNWQEYLPEDSDLTNGFITEPGKELFETFIEEIDEELTEILKDFAKEKKIGLDLLIFLLFGKGLCQVLDRPSIWLARELNGRTVHPEDVQLNQTVGWFTSIHPVKVVDLDNLHEFVSMNQFEVEKIFMKGFDYQFLNESYVTPNISYNYLGDLPEEIDLSLLNEVPDINGLDFFDELALNVGKQGETLTCVFLTKEKNCNLVKQIMTALEESIQQLTKENKKNVFGISTNTLIELNSLFI